MIIRHSFKELHLTRQSIEKKHKGDSYLSFRSQFLDSTYIMTINNKEYQQLE